MSWVWRFICYGTLSANPRRQDEESQGSNILTVQMGIQWGCQRPSSSTPIVDVHSGAMDLRQTLEYRSRTSAFKKNLSLRFTSIFHLTHLNSLYGQGLRQAKTPPKANLPITKVVKEKRLPKVFKGWHTHASPCFRSFPIPRGRKSRRENPYSFLRHPPSFNAKNALRQTKNQIPVTPTKGPLYFFIFLFSLGTGRSVRRKKRKHPPTTKTVNDPFQTKLPA
ncbi:hypothetical protein AVEN_127826-1 [Araneus ventricosus]|uniref:Uncharacterized protein n=1 Tax=Araneus ventricosus TaxID=182803 RepID=A0A4Y1ZYH7_ARAVE|nr:hypothetical protein AVEN_127826-1 [Araneus ventricosus]